MTKQHQCQNEFEDSDVEEEEQETTEEDWYVIESAFDLVTAMAAALGPQFGQIWKIFEKAIVQYASSTEHGQRSSAVGAIADAIRGMGTGITPFTAGLLKILLHRMSDEDALTKSNAAFAIGLLVENSENEDEIVESYSTILTKLEPLLHTQEARQLDNAAGCVSRMISKHADRVSLSEVLPALVSILPLNEDYEENEPIYSMIFELCKFHIMDDNTLDLTNLSRFLRAADDA